MSTVEQEESGLDDVIKAQEAFEQAEMAYFASNECTKDSDRYKLLKKARQLSLTAHGLQPNNPDYLRQLCSATGRLAEESGVRDRINLGFEFKKYLDLAISMDCEEDVDSTFELRHMRGRFSWTVANLSFIERTVARAIASLPVVSIDEAIEDLLKAHSIQEDSIENKLYLAKAYLTKKDKTVAKSWLEKVLQDSPENPLEEDFVAEAEKLLTSL